MKKIREIYIGKVSNKDDFIDFIHHYPTDENGIIVFWAWGAYVLEEKWND